MSIILAIIVLALYIASPLVGKVVLLIINSVVYDPIPFVDEIIMWIGLMQHLIRALDILEYIREHKKVIKTVVKIVGVCILVLIFLAITLK